jgi:hypothetical protein
MQPKERLLQPQNTPWSSSAATFTFFAQTLFEEILSLRKQRQRLVIFQRPVVSNEDWG